ncbi:MAG: CBS domain-containing protein [Deltaproteobacteria bacterium]|nr:CBS domain-containing protein [Deltaproteobacteria bacterium]
MVDHNIRHLPIVKTKKDENIIGILSLRDLAQAVVFLSKQE